VLVDGDLFPLEPFEGAFRIHRLRFGLEHVTVIELVSPVNAKLPHRRILDREDVVVGTLGELVGN